MLYLVLLLSLFYLEENALSQETEPSGCRLWRGEPSEAGQQGTDQVGFPEALAAPARLLVPQSVMPQYLLWHLPAMQPWRWRGPCSLC